ncbi:hypothetical protein SAY87_020317 [Trapa incisa]|uniref:Uncharacterized protein n=1 Tax=Trapa incisa TaxID=236973 RepID=A0AAN7Q3L7_9MYRT|nr:hypothetical protein SAY87_020317 [Trapa incisa]
MAPDKLIYTRIEGWSNIVEPREREMQRNEDDADRTSSNTEKKMMQIIQALMGDISE